MNLGECKQLTPSPSNLKKKKSPKVNICNIQVNISCRALNSKNKKKLNKNDVFSMESEINDTNKNPSVSEAKECELPNTSDNNDNILNQMSFLTETIEPCNLNDSVLQLCNNIDKENLNNETRANMENVKPHKTCNHGSTENHITYKEKNLSINYISRVLEQRNNLCSFLYQQPSLLQHYELFFQSNQ